MKIVFLVESLVHFLTEWPEILSPTHSSTEIGIVGIELEPDAVGKTINHGIHHIIHLGKEAAVHTDTIYHTSAEGFVDLLIGG